MWWINRLLRRKTLERELDREMQFHIDAAVDDHLRAGLSPAEARRRARIEFGGPEQMKEATRDVRRTRWVEDLLHDCRFALRGMRRSPAFALAVTLTIAVGVGANTAVWSIMDALLNRSLPVAKPRELHAVKRVGVEDGRFSLSHPLMKKMQATLGDSTPLAGMASIVRLYARIGERPEGVLAQAVSGNFLSTVGVRAVHGRSLTPADDEVLGESPVVVISDSFWERRFGRDPAAVGRQIRVSGFPVTIVGVLQPGFGGLTIGSPVDVFLPLAMQHELRYKGNAASWNADTEKPWVPQNGISWLTVIARTPPENAQRVAELINAPFRANQAVVLADRDSAARAMYSKERIALDPIARGFSGLRDQFRDPLRVLLAGVILILLITCANLTGLVLARGESRGHEIAIRASLGAMSGRLVRQVATESILLALIGGALGLVVAHWAIKALLLLASSGTRAIPLDASLDGRVLLYAFAVTLFAGIVVGLAPAIRVSRFDLYAAFKTGGRVSRGGHRLPLGRLLVTAQIALALILVTSAGVFVRTFRNFVNVDAGFDRETVVTARMDMRAAGYSLEQLPAMHQRLLDAARGVPGVQSASLSLIGLGPGQMLISGFSVPGRTIPPDQTQAQENFVSPGYFRTVGIPLLRGRDFTAADTKGRQRVVVVTEAFAKHFFGTTDVVGARFGYDDPELEIIGVARDVRVNGLKDPAPRMVYRALAQRPQYVQSLDARINGRPEAVIAGLRNAIASVDRDLPVREVVTMGSVIERGLSRERLVARLAGAFGVLALLLAAIGLYGVISYSVARRTNEMGVRLALGASPGGVSWLVLRDSLGVILTGLAVGVALWFPLLGLTRSLVYGVSPHDPRLLALSLGALLLVGVMAGMIPALRASRIDPIDAIRVE
jgi:predicted permease